MFYYRNKMGTAYKNLRCGVSPFLLHGLEGRNIWIAVYYGAFLLLLVSSEDYHPGITTFLVN
jgi:hypothetical protein